MAVVQSVVGGILNLLLWPFRSVDPIWPLLCFSLLTTVLFLWVFRKMTNPEKVRAAKNRLQAHVLELRLFKDSPRILFSALGCILFHNARYLRISLKPLLLMLLPILLLLVHLDGWFGYRPLHLQEAAVLTVKVSTSEFSPSQVTLEAPNGVDVVTPSLWIPGLQELSWTIRGKRAGIHRLVVRGLGESLAKNVIVSDTEWARVWPKTVSASFWNQFWNPGEAVLHSEARVEAVILNYPDRVLKIGSFQSHWLLVFFLASCLFGWVASRWMKVVV